MDNTQELKNLIDSFVEYRNVLVPLQETLKSISDTYGTMKEDLAKMEQNFGNEAKGQLNKIYESLEAQAKRGEDLSSRLDRFSKTADAYMQEINKLQSEFGEIENKLSKLKEIEQEYTKQMSNLNNIINETKLNYDPKDLQKSLDSYNKNVEKISDFINKDVANVLTENSKKIEAIKANNDKINAALNSENKSMGSLIEEYKATNAFLRKIVENNDVNESYLFDVLDKWAQDRKVKIKKKDN